MSAAKPRDYGANDTAAAVFPMVTAGRAIAKVADASGKRVVLIASCDHGHTHDPKGPYGFSPASKEFDDRVAGLVQRDALGDLLHFKPAFVADAKADSFWQMLLRRCGPVR